MRRRGSPWIGPVVTGLLVCLPLAGPSAQSRVAGGALVLVREDAGRPAPTGTDWVRALGGRSVIGGRERLLVVGRDGAILQMVEGEPDRVQLPYATALALTTGALRSATLVHNHTRLVGFSRADLQQLDKRGVDHVVAVTADGTVFAAAAGTHFDGTMLLDNGRVRDLDVRIARRLGDEAWRVGLPADDAQRQTAHVTGLVLAAVGVIDYQVTPSLVGRLEFDRYREIISRVAHLEVEQLRRERAVPDLPR